MQKCVRRRLGKQATSLGYALLKASPADALRRAAIVCLEDAVLHPHLPVVVWLMMAQAKGYKLSRDHQALLVRFFWDLASAHVRDDVDSNEVEGTMAQNAGSQDGDGRAGV